MIYIKSAHCFLLVLLSVQFGNRKPNLCPSCMPLFLSVFILLPSVFVPLFFMSSSALSTSDLRCLAFCLSVISSPFHFQTHPFILTSAFQADLTYLLRFFAVSTGVSNTQLAITFYSALAPILLQLRYSKYLSTLSNRYCTSIAFRYRLKPFAIARR